MISVTILDVVARYGSETSHLSICRKTLQQPHYLFNVTCSSWCKCHHAVDWKPDPWYSKRRLLCRIDTSVRSQSYCAPGTSAVQGVHPYTMNINGCTFRQLFCDASRITIMWTPSGTEVDADVLLAPRADIESNGAVNSSEAAAPDIGSDLQSSSPTGNESSSPVNNPVTGNVDDTDVASNCDGYRTVPSASSHQSKVVHGRQFHCCSEKFSTSTVL